MVSIASIFKLRARFGQTTTSSTSSAVSEKVPDVAATGADKHEDIAVTGMQQEDPATIQHDEDHDAIQPGSVDTASIGSQQQFSDEDEDEFDLDLAEAFLPNLETEFSDEELSEEDGLDSPDQGPVCSAPCGFQPWRDTMWKPQGIGRDLPWSPDTNTWDRLLLTTPIPHARPEWTGFLLPELQHPRPRRREIKIVLASLDKAATTWSPTAIPSRDAPRVGRLSLDDSPEGQARIRMKLALGLPSGIFSKPEKSVDRRPIALPTVPKVFNFNEGKRTFSLPPEEQRSECSNSAATDSRTQSPYTSPSPPAEDTCTSSENERDEVDSESDWEDEEYFDAAEFSEPDDGYDGDDDDTQALKAPRKLDHYETTIAKLKEWLTR